MKKKVTICLSDDAITAGKLKARVGFLSFSNVIERLLLGVDDIPQKYPLSDAQIKAMIVDKRFLPKEEKALLNIARAERRAGSK